ncbi:MAG: inner membrane CreD family protein [Proteobacteria bacterium]|nr:inner membrane CreD family protein [Pseudomonadota bacterium]
MKNPLLWKSISLALLVIVLMIPLSMVRSAIAERAEFRHEAQQDIATSWGGEQRLVGPLLVQKYEILVAKEAWDEKLDAYVEKKAWEPRTVVLFPDRLEIRGDATVQQRYRGIHAVPVYSADLAIEATLEVPPAPTGARNIVNRVVVGVGDTRGFRQQPLLRLDETPLEVLPGTETAMRNGVHAILDVEPGRYPVSAELALGGTGRFSVAPVGGNTIMQLSSNWPHPRFSGGYLPEKSDIGAAGFQADWQTSLYATTAREAVESCARHGNCNFAPTQLITVELADPVNIYLLNERSTKYGMLFVLVVFGVFLVFEVLKRLRVHPVQYGMVGLGQALFFTGPYLESVETLAHDSGAGRNRR